MHTDTVYLYIDTCIYVCFDNCMFILDYLSHARLDLLMRGDLLVRGDTRAC